LDACVIGLNRGESLGSNALSDYPEYAAQLEPLHGLWLRLRPLSPSSLGEAKRAGRQRLYAVLDKKRQPALWQRALSRHTALTATVSVVVIIAAISV